MDPRVIAPSSILRLNTTLYRNCLHGMTAEQAQARPADHANSAAFVALHLVQSRYFLLKLLGAETANPLPADLAAARSIDDVKQWPAHADLEAAWTTASHALRDRLAAMTAEELDAAVTVRFPAPEQTVFGALTFLVQHDSYHLGQLSLLRKQAGLPAMSYGTP
ncbi:MAG TPA: DinB family protein [Gemmatimonadaceae bacterium]|nr:DinB family protein [Gemmatimonadaceae bacterium]